MRMAPYVLAVALCTALGGCTTEQDSDVVAIGSDVGVEEACGTQAIFSLDVVTSGEWTLSAGGFAARTTIGHSAVSWCGAKGAAIHLSFSAEATLVASNWRTHAPVDVLFVPVKGLSFLGDGFSLDGGELTVKLP